MEGEKERRREGEKERRKERESENHLVQLSLKFRLTPLFIAIATAPPPLLSSTTFGSCTIQYC